MSEIVNESLGRPVPDPLPHLPPRAHRDIMAYSHKVGELLDFSLTVPISMGEVGHSGDIIFEVVMPRDAVLRNEWLTGSITNRRKCQAYCMPRIPFDPKGTSFIVCQRD